MYSRIDYDFQRAARFSEQNPTQEQIDLPRKVFAAKMRGEITTEEAREILAGRKTLENPK